MASKKKSPSFEIPEAVRHAGQAGWVYRTGAANAKAHVDRRAAVRPAGARAAKQAVAPVPIEPASAVPPADPAMTAPPAAPAPAATVAGRLVGLGLQVAAVPFMVPLFLTAAVSHRLGVAGDQ